MLSLSGPQCPCLRVSRLGLSFVRASAPPAAPSASAPRPPPLLLSLLFPVQAPDRPTAPRIWGPRGRRGTDPSLHQASPWLITALPVGRAPPEARGGPGPPTGGQQCPKDPPAQACLSCLQRLARARFKNTSAHVPSIASAHTACRLRCPLHRCRCGHCGWHKGNEEGGESREAWGWLVRGLDVPQRLGRRTGRRHHLAVPRSLVPRQREASSAQTHITALESDEPGIKSPLAAGWLCESGGSLAPWKPPICQIGGDRSAHFVGLWGELGKMVRGTGLRMGLNQPRVHVVAVTVPTRCGWSLLALNQGAKDRGRHELPWPLSPEPTTSTHIWHQRS